MEREIKFRAKDLNEKEWVYGYYVKRPDYSVMIYADVCRKGHPVIVTDPIDSKTVGQFTGLTDTNGKEIYDGDIIREYEDDNTRYGSWERFYVVEYGAYSCGAHTYYQWNCWEIKDGKKSKSHATLSRHSTYNKVVIGNIHDNPELLKTE